MSLTNDYLAQPTATQPKYQAKTEFDGVQGFIETAPRTADIQPETYADILVEHGFDPEKVRIVGTPRISRWTVPNHGWQSAYRFQIEAIHSAEPIDLDELVAAARDRTTPPATTAVDQAKPVRVLQLGDLQLGKGLASETPILTTEGWVNHGNLRVGMKVYGADGKPKAITKIWDTTTRDLYEVTFGDGTTITSDAEHLWQGTRKYHPKGHKAGWEQRALLLPTKELYEMYESSAASTMATRPFVIDEGQPAQIDDTFQPINPYLLGVWLGDGNRADGRVTICGDDADILDHFPHGPVYNEDGKNMVWTTASNLRGDLVALGLLQNKHVPENYVYASEAQRVAFIQGLMDTDGHCTGWGGCEFTNTNKSIIDAFTTILSLNGVSYHISESVGTIYGEEKQAYWRVYFRPNFTPFRAARKLARLRPSQERASIYRSIRSIEKIAPGEAQCITVEGGLYRAGKTMKVTHNCENGPQGIEDVLDRYLPMLTNFAKTIDEGQAVHVMHVGDCIEGNQSQNGANMGFQTRLTITEQFRVYRRLLMETVLTLAPHTPQLVVSVVNGNHDEADRRLNTKASDGWATEAAIAVADTCREFEHLSHVTVNVPPENQSHMTVDVAGTHFLVMHGHQTPRPGGTIGAEKWLKEAIFYSSAAAGAHIIATGHTHTLGIAQKGGRTFINSSTYDSGSDWFANLNGGAWQHPYATAYTVREAALLALQPMFDYPRVQ